MDEAKENNIKLKKSLNEEKEKPRTPLFKLVKNKKHKLHLIRNNSIKSRNLKLESYENETNEEKGPLNLQIFSYKILEARYNSTPELYLRNQINFLIEKKQTHFYAYMNDIIMYNNFFKEFLKRSYNLKEIYERIPKYVSYYKNYLNFFCRPVFCDFSPNKKMVQHMEKIAQIFYNENYAKEEDDTKKNDNKQKRNNNYDVKIFSSKIFDEIENYDKFSINLSNSFKENQKKYRFEDNYLITPILPSSNSKEKFILDKNVQTINFLIDELTDNTINKQNDNKSLFYLSTILKNNKNNTIIKKSKSKENNNIILIQQGKTTNNINININHILINQKGKSSNSFNKKIKRDNSINLKENSQNKNFNFYFQNFSNKNGKYKIEKIKSKNKNLSASSLTIPKTPSIPIGYNTNIVRKFIHIGTPSVVSNNNILLREIKSKSLLKNNSVNAGYKTSLHKKINNILKENNVLEKNQLKKISVYTDMSKNLKNIINIKNKNNNHVNNNILKNSPMNIFSSLIFDEKLKNKKIILNKNIGAINREIIKTNYATNTIKNFKKGRSNSKNKNTDSIEKKHDIFNDIKNGEKKIILKGKNSNKKIDHFLKIININFAPKNNRTNSCGKLHLNY